MSTRTQAECEVWLYEVPMKCFEFWTTSFDCIFQFKIPEVKDHSSGRWVYGAAASLNFPPATPASHGIESYFPAPNTVLFDISDMRFFHISLRLQHLPHQNLLRWIQSVVQLGLVRDQYRRNMPISHVCCWFTGHAFSESWSSPHLLLGYYCLYQRTDSRGGIVLQLLHLCEDLAEAFLAKKQF